MKNLIQVPRGKCHNKTESKTTVSLYLDKKLVERARNRNLNLSKVMEQALNSILDYVETPKQETSFSVRPFASDKRDGSGPAGN